MKYFFSLLLISVLTGCIGSPKENSNEQEDHQSICGDTVLLYSDFVVASVDDGTTIDSKDIISNLDLYSGLAQDLYIELRTSDPIEKVVIKDSRIENVPIYYIIDPFTGTVTDTIKSSELRGRYITSEQRDTYIDIIEKWKDR